MKWFQKKTEQQAQTGKSIFDNVNGIDKGNWQDVFSACLGKMLAIQYAADEWVIKDRDWNVDFSRGVILFGSDEYSIQFIGSESEIKNTWLWGWVNINRLDKSLLTFGNKIRALGKKWKLQPLIEEEIELNDCFNGHNLSIVACGLADEKVCYYRCPYSGGAAFVALSNVPEKVFASVGVLRFTSIIMYCVEQYKINGKILVESFLLWNNTPYRWESDTQIIAHFETDLVITFEYIGGELRIVSMKTL